MLYRGRKYVALTLDQKALKRDYKLEQQLASNLTPSVSNVLSVIDADPKMRRQFTRIEDRGNSAFNQAVEDLRTEGAITEKAMFAQDEATWVLIRKREREVAERILIDTLYGPAVARLARIDGDDAWRAVRLPFNSDPTRHARLGTAWSLYRAGAVTYFAGKRPGDDVRYRARVDTDYVDKAQTVARYVLWGGDEDEIVLLAGAPIHVYDVELEDGTIIEINDWRRT